MLVSSCRSSTLHNGLSIAANNDFGISNAIVRRDSASCADIFSVAVSNDGIVGVPGTLVRLDSQYELSHHDESVKDTA